MNGKTAVWIASGVAAVAVLVLLGVVRFSLNGLDVAAGQNATQHVFVVRAGESLHSIADRLQTRDLLPDRTLFGPGVLVAYARYAGLDRDVKIGEYDLAANMTPRLILEKLVTGAVKTHPVTIPEGLRLDEVAERLQAAEITSADAFLEKAQDAQFAQQLGVNAATFEGYLYPETYRFRRGTPAQEVVSWMFEEFRSRFSDEDRAAIAASRLDLHQILTLASIVEKETAVDAERPLVAAVYDNRLRKRMRLQSDPTVIYGILNTRGEWDGDIRNRDLREDTAYNTYTRSGLPPGPISSATIESIRAVLAPADVPYLYFVSRNDGTHVFSRTLNEHNQAVNRYQRRRRSGS
ncbi:MAG: endolytic transglycosylase MltG [bacterium]|nr:endolytic transglycosylase MltG [bacterium]